MTSEHIELREGVYYIPSTRVSLDSIVYAFRDGCSPESICEDFDGLTLAHVYGAITFYLDRQTDIDTYLLKRQELWAELERNGTSPSPELQARLARVRHSVSFSKQ